MALRGQIATVKVEVIDVTAPTVAIQDAPAAVKDTTAFSATFEFSEDVTGFELGDITVGNGTASNFAATDGNTYTADITPDGNGDITIDVAADAVTDGASNGNTAATQVAVTYDTSAPTVTLTGPTDVGTQDFTVTFTFSENVTGFEESDITVTNGAKGAFSGSGTTYTLVITPDFGTTVSISVAAGVAKDATGNGNTASEVFEVSAGSPASEFERHEAEIRTAIQGEARRSLQSTVSANQRMTRDARTRFILSDEGSDDDGGLASRNDIAYDVDGTLLLANTTLSTKGNFFQQNGNYEGTQRRLFFGDFDVQHDTDTGATTATLSGKIAWEYMVSEDTMLGYHIGVEVGRSNIDGAFEGDQDRIGVSLGGYVVTALQDNLFADGFVSFGVGRNNLAMGNGTLDLQGNYLTQTVTFGASLTGVIQRGTYEIWLELAFTYGKTFIGDVSFTGQAYGLVDNDLSLNAGDVSVANLTLRPEFRVPVDGRAVSDSLSLFGFAPRVLCEQVQTTVTTSACGAGAEFSWIGMSEDGMTNATARVLVDRIGQSTRSGLQLNLEHRF